MPIEFLYLAVVFAVAIIGFSILKRPLYECMLAAFVVLVIITGTWSNVGTFIWDALKEPTLYVIFVFIISHASSTQFVCCHLSVPHAVLDFQNTTSCPAHTCQTPAYLEPRIRQISIRTCIVKLEGNKRCFLM